MTSEGEKIRALDRIEKIVRKYYDYRPDPVLTLDWIQEELDKVYNK